VDCAPGTLACETSLDRLGEWSYRNGAPQTWREVLYDRAVACFEPHPHVGSLPVRWTAEVLAGPEGWTVASGDPRFDCLEGTPLADAAVGQRARLTVLDWR